MPPRKKAAAATAPTKTLLRDDARWKFGVPPLGNANYAWLHDAEVVCTLMAVDYETMRFELRSIQDWQVRSVRCKYAPEHESIVKTHGKKRVMIRGKADFDRDHNPRFVVVEKMEATP